MTNQNCIFCKIIDGQIPSEKIYEDKRFLVFMDINPVNEGHLLVIPKKHFQWMHDVPDNEISKIFLLSKRMMNALKKSTKCDFVVLSVVGIEVPHFHIHLVPRYFNDGLKNFWPTKKYKENEMRDFAEKIRKAI